MTESVTLDSINKCCMALEMRVVELEKRCGCESGRKVDISLDLPGLNKCCMELAERVHELEKRCGCESE